jgi:hypothetical protein
MEHFLCHGAGNTRDQPHARMAAPMAYPQRHAELLPLGYDAADSGIRTARRPRVDPMERQIGTTPLGTYNLLEREATASGPADTPLGLPRRPAVSTPGIRWRSI